MDCINTGARRNPRVSFFYFASNFLSRASVRQCVSGRARGCVFPRARLNFVAKMRMRVLLFL